MANIKPSDLILAFAFFVLVVFTMSWATDYVTRENAESIDPVMLGIFNNTVNKAGSYDDTLTSLQATIELTEPEQGPFGFLNSLVKSTWRTFKDIISNFGFITTALKGMVTSFGLPTFIITVLSGLILTVFAFGILSVVFNRNA